MSCTTATGPLCTIDYYGVGSQKKWPHTCRTRRCENAAAHIPQKGEIHDKRKYCSQLEFPTMLVLVHVVFYCLFSLTRQLGIINKET